MGRGCFPFTSTRGTCHAFSAVPSSIPHGNSRDSVLPPPLLCFPPQCIHHGHHRRPEQDPRRSGRTVNTVGPCIYEADALPGISVWTAYGSNRGGAVERTQTVVHILQTRERDGQRCRRAAGGVPLCMAWQGAYCSKWHQHARTERSRTLSLSAQVSLDTETLAMPGHGRAVR